MNEAMNETVGDGRGDARGDARDDASVPHDGGAAAAAADRTVSRRRALKVLGAVPLAALGGSALAQQPAQPPVAQPKTPHATPNQPAQPGVQPPKNAAAKRFFTAKEQRTIGVLADDIIPRDDRSPSATEAGVPAYLEFHMTVPETTDASRVAMRGGLAWLDRESRARFAKPYASLAESQRHAILDDIAFAATAKPEFRQGAAFFSRFRDMVASGFFSSSVGWQDLRYQGNVFNPDWQGCPKPALDKLGVSYEEFDRSLAARRKS